MSWIEWLLWKRRISQKADADRNQAIIASIDSLADELATSRQQQAIQDSGKAKRERWTIGLLSAAAICAFWQLQTMKGEVEEMRAAQRPLVFAKITGPFMTNGDWTYLLTIKNTGNSPTVGFESAILTPADDDFRMMGEAEKSGRYSDTVEGLQDTEKRIRSPEDPASLFEREDIRNQAHINIYNMMIGPRDEIPFGNAWVIQLHIDQMASGDNSSYYYGAIRYFDFPDRKTPHVTEFCYDLVNGIFHGKDGKMPIAAPCKYWNCIDQECERDKKRYEAEVKALRPIRPR